MQTIDIHRQRDHERFEDNRRFEEMTDIAERLGYPIDTTISYALRGDVLYALSDTVDRPFRNQTFLAMKAGEHEYTGNQSFQRQRLFLEHQEALLADELAYGKLGGNILIKYSKIPDAVVEGRTDIKGYRRDLLRSFVRIYYRTDTGVNCRLFTLDGNNPTAVAQVGELLGIDTTRPSEVVLADYRLLDITGDLEDFVAELVRQSIQVFDGVTMSGTGIQTHAGSRYHDKQDAMSAIRAQPSLVSQHMDAIAHIMGQGSGKDVLEQERKKTAAAIKLASDGYTISSSGGADVASEVASGNYDGDCPTPNGMNQAAQNLENKWTAGECQVCFTKTKVGSCMVCAACELADNLGEDLLELRQKNLKKRQIKQAMAQRAQTYGEKSIVQPRREKREIAEKQYDRNMTLKKVTGIGHDYQVVAHKYTGEVIRKL